MPPLLPKCREMPRLMIGGIPNDRVNPEIGSLKTQEEQLANSNWQLAISN
jgi:hypothetical protein